MTTLAQAERYRDAMHDLPDYDAAREAQIMERAGALAEQAFELLDAETIHDEWIETNIDRFIDKARLERP